MNRFQFTISRLMLATFAVAAFCVLFAPFDPAVTFHTTILPDAELADGTQSPIGFIQIKNGGISSVWYEGEMGTVTTFFSASGPDTSNVVGFMTTDYADRWTELKPGDTASARFLIGNANDKIHFAFGLRDWRGRRVWRSNGQIKDVSTGFGTKRGIAKERLTSRGRWLSD